MKLRRWGRVFSSILVLSFLLAGFVFPMLGSRVEASAQNARLAPVEGTSVTIESDSFFGGNISFSLRLNGCSGYKKATITVVFSANCAIRQQRGYVAPTCSDGSSAYFTDRKTLTVTTTDRSALKGESSISISGAVNAEVTVSSAQVSSAELKDEIFLQEEYAVVGDDRFNQVSFGYYNMNGTLELKVTKAYEKSGKDVNISINDGGNTIGITVTTKDLSPITDMTICLEITADGNPRFGNYRPTYNYIEPTPTPTPIPTSTPTPIPTSTPTPVPTSTPTPIPVVETTETTAAPTATPIPTKTPTPVPESSETSEETSSEETSETEPLVIAPVTSETEPSDTEPSEEPTTSETKKAVVRASTSSDDSTDYSTYILLGILFILVILVYLRYSHLAKKEMPFPEICKNFIPVGAVVDKVKSLKKAKEPDPDEPKPEVMNGYLQKPTVGAAAARAVRPVRSNVSGTENQPKTENAEKTEQKPASDSPAPQRPGRRAMAPNTDPELLEMERRQKIMEQEMNQLFSNKNQMKTDLLNESGEGSVPND